MPRLQYNPNLEPPVNAADEAFLNLVRACAPEGQEAEVAAQFALLLEDAHRQRVDAWEAQQAADREVMEEEEAIRVANEAARREEARKEAEAELKERDKKRPKLADIGRDTMIDSSLRPPVPAYAVEKLAKFDYVPLWYFTNEAREELRNMLQSTSDDTYQLANGDEGVVLRSAHAAAHAKKVIPDSNLTWNQISRAFPDLLSKMEDLRWPQQHVDSLARFFTKLVMHPYLNKTNGEAILLRYQARARLDWHETIRRPHKEGEKVYDISYISVALLRTIEHDIAIEISNLRSEESREETARWKVEAARNGKERVPNEDEDLPPAKRQRRRGNQTQAVTAATPYKPASQTSGSNFRKAANELPCAVCLGRQAHNISTCAATVLWNSTTAGCKRNRAGQIVTLSDKRLCLDFQRSVGCTASGHLHECSGCGGQDHGASLCILAQKA